jgi:outer membrane protein assembly factor BamD (BamD/ComL family)
MKSLRIIFGFVTTLALMGCTGDKAQELYETAQFEERQHNEAHAKELYEQIVSQYPKSEVTKKASERLAQLTREKTPSPGSP